VIFWDTDNNIGQTTMLSDNDFLGQGLIVSSYASQLITRAITTDGNGLSGVAGGTDPFYGEWEDLQSPSEEAQTAGTTPTLSQLQSQAKVNLVGHNPTPMLIRVPDGSSINPKGVLQLGDFVPGIYMPVQATIHGRIVSQWQKLDKVVFNEDAKGESIAVTMGPAPLGAVIV
jgi:hypothetical protein